jgi:hypothetical protein
LTIQLNELYLKLDAATPFRRIVFDNIERASKKKRKKKNGLRNGKTEYIDTNKKTVNKEMYKDGKQKNNFKSNRINISQQYSLVEAMDFLHKH